MRRTLSVQEDSDLIKAVSSLHLEDQQHHDVLLAVRNWVRDMLNKRADADDIRAKAQEERPRRPNRQRYEYRFVQPRADTAQRVLDEHAEAGWEVRTFNRNRLAEYVDILFERRVPLTGMMERLFAEPEQKENKGSTVADRAKLLEEIARG